MESPSRLASFVVALDYGRARVGVAILYVAEGVALSRPAFDGRDRGALLRQCVELARDEGVGRFVVGLPVGPTGAPGKMAREVAKFAKILEQQAGIPVELLDERLSSKQAAGRLAELGRRAPSGALDSESARVLLETWAARGSESRGVDRPEPNE